MSICRLGMFSELISCAECLYCVFTKNLKSDYLVDYFCFSVISQSTR